MVDLEKGNRTGTVEVRLAQIALGLPLDESFYCIFIFLYLLNLYHTLSFVFREQQGWGAREPCSNELCDQRVSIVSLHLYVDVGMGKSI